MSALERFIAYQAENVGHADEDAMLEWECLIAEMYDENSKLREFAKMFAKVAHEVGCDHCSYCDPDLCDEETDPMEDGCRLYDELRELGVADD